MKEVIICASTVLIFVITLAVVTPLAYVKIMVPVSSLSAAINGALNN